MLYVQLDTNWPDHPKIIRAGYDGAGLHATVMCLAKRSETDGWVDRLTLTNRYGAPAELIDRCISLDLLESDGERVRPDGWHDRNLSQAAIDAIRATKGEAGRMGNHKRWHGSIPYESCPKCQVIAGCDTVRNGCDRTVSPESETEVATAIAPAMVLLAPPPPLRIPPDTTTLALDSVSMIRTQHFGLPDSRAGDALNSRGTTPSAALTTPAKDSER